MNSNRPYLLRALYEWICDDNLTPYLLVEVVGDDINVPFDFVEEGKIILNIAPSAVRELDLGNDYVSFKARFSSQSMNVYFPVHTVLAIYAKENGQGMTFQEKEQNDKTETEEPSATEKKETPKKAKPPHLRIVK